MDFKDIMARLPEKGIAALARTVKIYFRTQDQTQKMINCLKQYAKELEPLGTIAEIAACVEKAVEEANNAINEQTNKTGQRVRVKDGAGNNVVGYGTYEGQVDVYFIRMADGSLQSLPNAEEKPTHIPPGGVLVKTGGNPKIRLDSGKIVYGCQVWWEVVPPERDVLPIYQHAGSSFGNN
jgi:hypothetical protein